MICGFSIFETLMLLCFGLAWPLSIYRSFKSRTNKGKSIQFLVIVFIGYVAGSIHKVLFCLDYVLILYILNGTMVLVDILLYVRNSRIKDVDCEC
jgi:hypothetical protein